MSWWMRILEQTGLHKLGGKGAQATLLEDTRGDEKDLAGLDCRGADCWGNYLSRCNLRGY